MADKADKPKTVQMTAVQAHSYHGQEYGVGDTYDADEGDVVTIQIQGKGIRSDAVQAEKPAKAKK